MPLWEKITENVSFSISNVASSGIRTWDLLINAYTSNREVTGSNPSEGKFIFHFRKGGEKE